MTKLKTRKLKVGIIGLGVGESHILGYRAHPECEVALICDLSKEKLSEVHGRYSNLVATTDPDEILNDPEIDIVSIASYDSYHYQQIIKALQNNKHIFVEKPICLSETEAKHIRVLSKEKPNLKISSNLILRKSPRFYQLKQMILDGQLGKLFYVEGDYHYGRLQKITEGWRGKLDFYSVVYGGGVHLVDLLLWLTGDEVIEVSAYGNQMVSQGSQFKYNDCVVAILKFKSGMIGKVTTDFGGVRPHFHGLNLYGTKATFLNDTPNGKWLDSRDPAQQAKEITPAYPGVQKSGLIFNCVDSIVNGTEPEVSLDEVLAAMSVCFAIEESAKQNVPIRVKSL